MSAAWPLDFRPARPPVRGPATPADPRSRWRARRPHALVAAILLTAVSLRAALPTIASAQTLRTDLDVPYGTVLAQARLGNTLYLGGDFDHIGPITSKVVKLAPTTGRLVHDVGVYALPRGGVSDGAGGVILTGGFETIGRPYERTIMHIRADGSLGPLDPRINGNVWDMEVHGSTLYLGGYFSSIDGYPRVNVAAIDIRTNTVTPWDAGLGITSQVVASLAVANGLVYMAGVFRGVGGDLSRVNAAAVDTISGALAPWNPTPNDLVLGLAADDSLVYLAGNFSSVNGETRANLAAVDAMTGALTSWNPAPNSTCATVVKSGSTVFVGGLFTRVAGAERKAFAAIDAVSGEALSWPAFENARGPAAGTLLTTHGSTLYLAGDFSHAGTESRLNVAAIDMATRQLTPWNPGCTSRVHALAADDSGIYAAGYFNRIGGEHRNRLAAIDLVTGRTTDWNPDANDVVRALAVSGSTVYAGGSFGRVGGEPHKALVAIDASSGAPSAGWTATADGSVRALAVSGPQLYVGGSFTHLNAQPRSRIGALDASSGIPTAWQPDADSTVRALVARGSTVYVGGDFNRAGGADRMRVAALDSVTGNARPWDTHTMSPGENVYALAMSGSTLYVGGNFTEAGGQPRRNLAALDATTGTATGWNHDFEKSVYAFTVGGASGSVVFVGGGGDFSNGIAALDAITGDAANWHPPIHGAVHSLTTDGTYVYAGGESGIYGIEALGVTGTLLSLFQAEATSDGIVLRWQFGGAAEGASFGMERSEGADGPWIPLEITIRREGERFVATDPEVTEGRTYRYRLVVAMAGGSVTFGPIEASTGRVAEAFALSRISPSPATGPVTIEFTVARAVPMRISVLDVHGRVMIVLVDSSMRPGRYQAVWQGDYRDGPAPVGVYFVRLEAAGVRASRRVVLYR